MSWQEQPSPNSNYTDTLVNDIRGLRLEKDAHRDRMPAEDVRVAVILIAVRDHRIIKRIGPGGQFEREIVVVVQDRCQ